MAQRGRIALAIAAAVAIAGAVVVWWWLARAKPFEGFLVGLYAVDDQRAVVCMRANYKEDPSRAWVALLHREQGVVWGRELPAVPIQAPHDGLSVAGGVVTVRTGDGPTDNEPLTTVAYSLASGALLWHQVLAEAGAQPSSSAGPLANDELHIAAYEAPGGVKMVAFARQSGEVVWKRFDEAHGPVLDGPRLAGPHLLAEPVAEALFYSIANDSPPLELDSRGPGCLLGDRYYVLGSPADEPDALFLTSVVPAPDELREPVFHRVELPWFKDTSGHVMVEACGTYQGSVVFTIMRAREGTVDGLELAALDPDTGELDWYFDLGKVRPGGSLGQFTIDHIYRPNAPLSGELTRFIPLLLDEHREGEHTRLAILDLDERRVIREGPKRHELIFAYVFRVGTTNYVVGRLVGPFLVAAMDGTTGELHAIHLYRSYAEVLPFHVRDGTLWVYTKDWHTIGGAPWAALDARTLSPLHNNGVDMKLADSAALEILGAGQKPAK